MRLLHWYAVLSRALRRTVLTMIAHDCLNMAQSAAYSAIVSLFPTLIVGAAVISLLPGSAPVRFQLSGFIDRLLPPSISPLLDAAFQNTPEHDYSLRMLAGAGVVSFFGAASMISTLMEGLRRARGLPRDYWSFWQRQLRSIILVPLSLMPLAIASLLVVFGHAVNRWLVSSIGPQSRAPVYDTASLLRWAVAMGASVGLIALIYYLGVPARQPEVATVWNPRAPEQPLHLAPDSTGQRPPDGSIAPAAHTEAVSSVASAASNVPLSSGVSNTSAPTSRWSKVLPGAVLATVLWFLATIIFGWYVTGFTDYSQVYGPLGAGIALLFWLYIISLSVLCGAEFNVHFNAQVFNAWAEVHIVEAQPFHDR